MPFDFNPVNLQDPKSPSVVTYRELQKTSDSTGNEAEVLAPSPDKIAKRLAALPEVSRSLMLNSFVPSEQNRKIAVIKTAYRGVGAALNPRKRPPPPTDQDQVAAIQNAADDLARIAGDVSGPGAEAARRVSDLLKRLASGEPELRNKAEDAVIQPLQYNLDRLHRSLNPQHVTAKTLPPDLVRDWMLPDGRARVQALSNDSDVLRTFAIAVLNAEPAATGPAITYYESGRTITTAFIEAGALALVAIAVLLVIALRRLTDVLLTLVPLLLAGAVALEICALTGFALNFANIIALPQLLGVGVAFKIYYNGLARRKDRPVQLTLTRAVIFSATTNAIAFGSMWASSYPGMSSGQDDGVVAALHDGCRRAVLAGADRPSTAAGRASGVKFRACRTR